MKPEYTTASPERDPDYLDRLITENEAASFASLHSSRLAELARAWGRSQVRKSVEPIRPLSAP